MRETHHAARDGKHRAEFGIGEADEQDHDPADQPGQDRGGAGLLGGIERAKQPAGADDGTDGGEQQADDADVAFQPPLGSRTGTGLGR